MPFVARRAWVEQAERLVDALGALATAREELARCRALLQAAEIRDNIRDAELVRSEARYQELMADYRAVVHPKVPELQPSASIERELPDEVTRVIREQSEADGRIDHALARHLRKHAKTLKREGKSTDAIIGELVSWQTFDGGTN